MSDDMVRRTGGGEQEVEGFRGTEFPPPDTDEREVVLGFIRWQREQVVAATARVALAAADSAP
ncbi:MAG: hypothetical protein JWM72_3856 [Actinomycetia bacterium]|jgi:hypothetical protein|nr:hypothetical protein [Actinomycetes bacterium]